MKCVAVAEEEIGFIVSNNDACVVSKFPHPLLSGGFRAEKRTRCKRVMEVDANKTEFLARSRARKSGAALRIGDLDLKAEANSRYLGARQGHVKGSDSGHA